MLGLELGDDGLRLGLGSCGDVDSGVVLEQDVDELFAEATGAARYDEDLRVLWVR